MKIKLKISPLMVAIGAFSIAFAQLLFHFFQIPDFMYGSLLGMGIGFMILAIIYIGRKS